ncbi:hypothetical protein DAPPUDRAFT_255323 [Daphnia pulex]|uniref:Uncharacterized protein n=1 Tax=Daphnia pulex TaxID=6669 RepID=E9H8Z0_DAPPU|nr:hypothetical protein DAPPUDRAFT_255323 [Daphnia pulex]|eukprot:EFX71807.1 hypothetical protein DAPPUDRAFT_255323 [Daphnia pulex]
MDDDDDGHAPYPVQQCGEGSERRLVQFDLNLGLLFRAAGDWNGSMFRWKRQESGSQLKARRGTNMRFLPLDWPPSGHTKSGKASNSPTAALTTSLSRRPSWPRRSCSRPASWSF